MRHLEIEGMNVTIAGTGDPLVFVHGFTTTSGFWKNQLPVFSKTHQTVLFDLPGHGESAKPTDRLYTIDAFKDDVLCILDHLKIHEATLVGLSMGGTIVQSVYFHAPSRISALVLVGTTAHGLGPAVQKDTVLARIEAVGIEDASCEVIRNSFVPGTTEEILLWAEAEVVKTPRHVAEVAIQSLNQFDSREQLSSIEVPTLIMVGEEDNITPIEESRYLSSKIPGAQIQIIKGAAHFPMIEKPSQFNSVLATFLAKNKTNKNR